MLKSLLDTDILNEVLKQKNANVIHYASEYLHRYQQFSFSSMTWYEILRGLQYKAATRQLENFSVFCSHCTIYPISDSILKRAAELWVMGATGGYPHRDADLIIAATAIELDYILVTGNTKHFSWILGLAIANWRQLKTES